MINKLTNNNFIRKILIIFLIIQPLLDVYILFEDKITNIFIFSPSTIIRIIIIGIMMLATLISIKYNRKYLWFVAYFIFLIVYFLFHHYNGLAFKVNLSGNYNYSLIKELFYIIRMILPFLISFIVFHIEIKKEDVYKVVSSICLIISITIIVSNVLCISLPSYGTNSDRIKASIFMWFFNFNERYSNVDLSSRGFFNSANQLGPLLSMLLPILIFSFIKTNNKKYFYSIILTLISLLMIGTRISSYSWIAIFIVIIILYLYFVFIKKDFKFDKKIITKLIVIFISTFLLLQVSPIKLRRYASDYKDVYENIETDNNDINPGHGEVTNDDNKDINLIEYYKFVESNYRNYPISRVFIEEIYNYKYDPEFWYNVMKLPYDSRSDSRQIQKLITYRIYSLNNNPNDKWFGMSFSRLRNGDLYLEKDLEVHFYTLGIVGSLLLVYPYIIVLIIVGIKFLRKFNKIKFEDLIYCFSIGLFIMFGYFAGSVLDQLVITIIAGFILGIILRNYRIEDV